MAASNWCRRIRAWNSSTTCVREQLCVAVVTGGYFSGRLPFHHGREFMSIKNFTAEQLTGSLVDGNTASHLEALVFGLESILGLFRKVADKSVAPSAANRFFKSTALMCRIE